MPRPWLRARATLLCAIPLLCLIAPVFFGRSFFQRDLQSFTYPIKRAVRDRLLAGELPLWSPQLGLGRPILGLVQPGAFYPLNALLALPWPFGMDLFMLAHLVLGLVGAHRWLRAEGLDPVDASVGALVFALSGYAVSVLATNGAYAWGVMWIPFALAAVRRAADATTTRAALGPIALGALSLAMTVHAGDPMAFGLGAALLALRAGALPAAPRLRGLAALVGITSLGLVLCLAVLLPAREVASVGRGGGVPFFEASQYSMHPSRLIELVWANAFGAPYSRSWFVHALYDEGSGSLRDPFAPGIYLGIATPLLALCALRRRERLDVVLLAIAVTSGLIALGRFGPLWAIVYAHAPGARYFRYPEKYFVVTSLCLAALAARGLAPCVADLRRSLRVALGVTVALALAAAAAYAKGPALAVALVGQLYHVPAEEAGRSLGARAAFAAVWMASYTAMLSVASRRAWPAERTRLALAALIAMDLTLAAAPLIDTEDSEVYLHRSPVIAVVHAGAPDIAPPRVNRELDGLVIERSLQAWFDAASLYPNAGMDAGVAHLDPVDIFPPARERRLREALALRPARLLAIRAARFAMVRSGVVPRWTGAREVRSFRFGFTLLEIPDPVGRLHLAARAVPAASVDEAARLVAADDFAPGRDAVIEGGDAREAHGRCVLVRYAPERVEGRCESDAPAWAVLADLHFPGWSATVNGAPTEVLPANVAMRGVRVPAGASQVVFRYAPAGLGPGIGASLAALLACAAMLALTATRRAPRRPRPRSARTGGPAAPA